MALAPYYKLYVIMSWIYGELQSLLIAAATAMEAGCVDVNFSEICNIY